MEAASFLAAVKLKLPVYFGVDGNAAFTLYEFDKNSTTEIAMQKKRANQTQSFMIVVKLVRSYCVE